MTSTIGPLDGFRVLDLATARGELAGRVLADLGAEVIKVEPPGGAAARSMGPFAPADAGRSAESLYWKTVAMGKRSVELDAFEPADAAKLRALARGADVWIESFDPGVLQAVGLDYSSLAVENPALVYASITPFGADGPFAHKPATDLVVEAAGGLLGLQGDSDRAPVPVGFPQASFHAGAQAAADIAIALHERLASGRGQHLDVSAQSAIVWTLMNATGYPPMLVGNPPGMCERRGGGPAPLVPGLRIPLQARCKDGYTLLATALPVVGERTLHALLRWMEARGELPDAFCAQDWTKWIADLLGGVRTPEQMTEVYGHLVAFLGNRSKRELLDFATENTVLVAPVYDMRDLREDPQLAAREFWTDVGGVTHLGPFARLSKTPLQLKRPAPALAADQALVDGPPRAPLSALAGRAPGKGALAGVKVADFSWVGVGPIISKALADHGATVIHVESEARPDVLRFLPPFLDGQPGINRGHFFANFNTSKKGVAINLGVDAGAELARKLADWADVVVESFTPGTLEKFGLDYATLSADRPELVMLSTCMRGQTGPEAGYTGFGNQGASLAGMVSITGWPDRAPSGPWGAYTDFIAPRYAVSALVAALVHKARTGVGQYIDVSQIEAGMHFLEPLALDYTTNGKVAPAAGHTSRYACPHGVYACAGPERYVAMSIETEAQWAALCRHAPLAAFAALDSLGARLEEADAIDDALRAHCATRNADALADRWSDAGVPASVVRWPTDLYRDPQLVHRGFFVALEHSEMGHQPFDGFVTRFSRTPGELRSAAPTLGEHTFEVLQDVLGLTPDEIAEYAINEAIS